MAYFTVYAHDKPGMADQRQTLRPAHRERLRRHDHPVIVRVGGPLLDEHGAMIGTMLVVEAEDKAAVEAFIAADPYVSAGLYADCEIVRFNWGLGLPEAQNG